MLLATFIHVTSALIALTAATVAVSVSKGMRTHIRAGQLFVVTMIIMAIPAGVLSYQSGKIFDVFSSLLTVYMVLTGAIAFKPDLRAFLIAMMCLVLSCIAGYLAIEVHGLLSGTRATDAPKGAGYVFATILGCALYGDVRHFRRSEHKRLTILLRHLWRMNFAFFIATLNLFAVRPQLFPDWMQSSGLLMLLAFAPLLIMGFWRFKLLFKRWRSTFSASHTDSSLGVLGNVHQRGS